MTAAYYVRVAGKVYGPFDAGRLKSLAAAGKLAPHHEISRDRARWVPAGNVKGLFARSQRAAERQPTAAPANPAVAPRREHLPAHPAADSTPPAGRRGAVDRPSGRLVPLWRGSVVLAVTLVAGLAVAALWVSTLSQGEYTQPPLAPGPQWADARQPQQLGDVRLRLASVKIGHVPLEGLLAESHSSERLLVLRVTIENRSQTRKIDFHGFNPELSTQKFAVLSDNFQNSYRHVGFGAARPKGQVTSASIYPGKSLDDLLVFELPVERAEFLRLELPGANLHHHGSFRFQIPCAEIER